MPNLICCEQGYYEFIRNRDRVLKETLENILKNKMDFYTTAFTRQLPEFPDLEHLQKEYKVVHKKFVDSARNILSSPQNDPIFTEFVNLYNPDETKKYRISDKIIDNACIKENYVEIPLALLLRPSAMKSYGKHSSLMLTMI